VVLRSQKPKDRTTGPVFSGLGPVQLRSFCSLETGLPSTITIYEYDDLTKNFDDAHEFLNMVDKKLKGDIDFLDHVLRTSRQMEDTLANQRQVATNIFN